MSATQLKLQDVPVTRENFARLPLWCTAAQALWATGWTSRELAAAVAAGEISVRKNRCRRKGYHGNYQKYSKPSLAQAIGLTW